MPFLTASPFSLQGKDRNERLKGMLAATASINPSAPQQQPSISSDAEDMFHQMKKILALHSVDKKPSTSDAAAQHESKTVDAGIADKGMSAKKEVLSPETVSYHPIMHLLYFLLNKGSLVSFFDAINYTYPFLSSQAQLKMNDDVTRDICQGVFESYLELLFHGSKHLSPIQQHKVGEFVYVSLSGLRDSNGLSLVSFKTSLLLHLIPLVTIDGQPEVTDALLEGILMQSNRSIPTRKFLVDIGLGTLFGVLQRKSVGGPGSTLDLVSTILLTLLTEGMFLPFCRPCQYY